MAQLLWFIIGWSLPNLSLSRKVQSQCNLKYKQAPHGIQTLPIKWYTNIANGIHCQWYTNIANGIQTLPMVYKHCQCIQTLPMVYKHCQWYTNIGIQWYTNVCIQWYTNIANGIQTLPIKCLTVLSSHLKLANLSVERKRVEEHRTNESDVSCLTEI